MYVLYGVRGGGGGGGGFKGPPRGVYGPTDPTSGSATA